MSAEDSVDNITVTTDPDLLLSEHTLNALKEFYTETYAKQNSGNKEETDFEENWQLSQFWYSEETANYLSDEVIHALNLQSSHESEKMTEKSIACISCPTLFDCLYRKLIKDSINQSIKLILFEFDKRFQMKYPSNYVFYDYNQPLDNSFIDRFTERSFDVVIADPPFLSDECLRKTSETINYLANDKILLCTGSVMRHTIDECLHLQECHHFEPKHNRKLGNEFKCFSNFNLRPIDIN
ncbi:EEF1A lysine methyltransferase 1-like [Oppia nitens]|uniref:EEF1A lysine methyltransferase 1-like n=1 Tax=Oppia nitens TaxID=1686743 RepID=UPI0023DCBF61|nr:EEF1A lysine methyltransferase 1-like [Oppia nitens]